MGREREEGIEEERSSGKKRKREDGRPRKGIHSSIAQRRPFKESERECLGRRRDRNGDGAGDLLIRDGSIPHNQIL